MENIRRRPYEDELYILDEEKEVPEEFEGSPSKWCIDMKRRKLICQHPEGRSKILHPAEQGCPVPLHCLTSRRRTVRTHEDGSRSTVKGDWRKPKTSAEECIPTRSWVGYTEFTFKEKFEPEKYINAWMVKRSSDEVREEDITEAEWPKWRETDGSEWGKVAQTGAVIALREEESELIEKQLKEAGLTNRILPSRMVRRWKPSEQPGVPPSRKSRWCIRGDRDPDLLSLNRYSPTVTTAVVNIALQLAANRGFKTYVADLKNAFMQSERLVRERGRLFCRQPRGGLPGLKPGQLIEIMAGAYGLGDAPAHWRKSLRGALLELGYEPSAMDPCTFKYMARNHAGARQLQGLVVVEVDEAHGAVLERLQQRFTFGKFVNLDTQESGASFNGRSIRALKGGGYAIDMEKFISERLNKVPFNLNGRKKDEDATDQEKDDARAAIGALTWAAKEGRPDCAAGASIIASCLNKLKVQDVIDLNKIITEAKDHAAMTVTIQKIENDKVCFGVITDASYANTETYSSQGGFGILCYDKDLESSGIGKGNLL